MEDYSGYGEEEEEEEIMDVVEKVLKRWEIVFDLPCECDMFS